MLSLFPSTPKSITVSDMELRGRKILGEICTLICPESCSTKCACVEKCIIVPPDYSYSPPTPPTPPISIDGDDHPVKPHNHKISTFLIVVIALLAATFFVLFCYAIFTRCRRRRVPQQQTEDPHDAFVDEEHGPMVDHPIWYIRTAGLQQSIISAITVCKYKKGEGLIEGTECSVCLSEFEEDENLRLLPKCNHAFHLPCIDTWLRSHTNCPLCRAPIVTNPARIIAAPEPNLVDSSSGENTQMEIVEISSENNEGLENIAPELRVGEEEEGQLEGADGRRVCESSEVENLQPRRRSVSLDSPSVQKISLALGSILADGNSNRQMGSKRVNGNENLAIVKGSSSSFRIRSLQIASTSMKRSRSFNGKHLLSSWYSRSQRKPSLPVRSF